MKISQKIIFQNIATISLVAMFFSCTNNTKKVRDFLADKNLPIGVAKEAYYVYKDSGRITSKIITPHLNDFSNRKDHPYKEFPKGIKIISFEKNGIDSITVTGNYALTFDKTNISELIGNVIVINHSENTELKTEQLYWDRNTNYFFSEKKFTLTNKENVIHGIGFESKNDLKQHVTKHIIGDFVTKEQEL